MKKKYQAYLLTGSNIGDKAVNLQFAIDSLAGKVGNITNCSAVYATEPWGVENQPTYYNQAIGIQTNLSPTQLLRKLKQIEKEAGRLPNSHMQPRVLDIDILLIDDLIIQTKQLKVPHHQLENRNFAIIPLAEIAPNLIYPKTGETILELAQNTGDTLAVEKVL